MVTKFKLSKQAALEYERIVEYLSIKLQSPQAASNFEEEFLRVVKLACVQPEVFPLSQYSHLAKLGYRKLLINKYIALYTYRNNMIIVGHIFHQTQDYARMV
ncbi:MAG: type II toxin-antitoxin system RelE/ParE family toxin [Coriobacteriia bacterium]|nr:type II toxin-antitoxin system RelE/ParE family toxin [Coriobacteriia bacterium]